MRSLTVREAAEQWVHGFNAIRTTMIEKLREADLYAWLEVTQPTVGNRVCFRGGNATGEIVKVGKAKCQIQLDGDKKIWAEPSEFFVDRLAALPEWGTMWSVSDPLDVDWIEEGTGVADLSACGFRVYVHGEWGFFFGIDGGGYDFFADHWIPLYKKRGLHWHTEEETA